MRTLSFRIIIFAFIAFLPSSVLFSQQSSGGSSVNVNSSSYGYLNMDYTSAWNKVFITDRPTYTNNFLGSPFIENEWQLADIIVLENKGEIRNMPVRIDAKYNLIEIKDEDRVKVLHATNTYSVAFKNSKDVFVSNKTLGISEPEGFFKVVYSNESSLLCHYSTKVIESSYNAVLDAGIKDDKMIIDQTYYILKDGKLIKLEKNRKRLMHQFNDKPSVVQYIKDQHIMPKAESDLIKLMGFIDSRG